MGCKPVQFGRWRLARPHAEKQFHTRLRAAKRRQLLKGLQVCPERRRTLGDPPPCASESQHLNEGQAQPAAGPGPRRPVRPLHSPICAQGPGAARSVAPLSLSARQVRALRPAQLRAIPSLAPRTPHGGHHPTNTIPRVRPRRPAPLPAAQGPHCVWRGPGLSPAWLCGPRPADTIPRTPGPAALRPCLRPPRVPAPKTVGPHCARLGPQTPPHKHIPESAQPIRPAPLPAAPAQVGAGWRRGATGAPRGRGRRLRPGFVRAPRPPAARAPAPRAPVCTPRRPRPADPRPPSGWFAA